jgi:hypothetical protein
MPLHWQECDTVKACVALSEAHDDVKNKLRVAKWMLKMNAIVTYYEKTTDPVVIPALDTVK